MGLLVPVMSIHGKVRRLICQDLRMTSIEVEELAPGEFRLYLVAGTTPVDEAIVALGHEPNGPFWEGITELVVAIEAPALHERFWTDSEAGAFLAHSSDRSVLDDLAARLDAIAVDENRLRHLMEAARARGFEFHD
ncbi:Imm51 family immunity protein [Actinoplanes utahensis]|nr:Imm51 family immunity protein [Actinoplanes utahensis]